MGLVFGKSIGAAYGKAPPFAEIWSETGRPVQSLFFCALFCIAIALIGWFFQPVERPEPGLARPFGWHSLTEPRNWIYPPVTDIANSYTPATLSATLESEVVRPIESAPWFHPGTGGSIATSPTENVIAIDSNDGSIRLWTTNGAYIASYSKDVFVGFSHDGNALLSGRNDGSRLEVVRKRGAEFDQTASVEALHDSLSGNISLEQISKYRNENEHEFDLYLREYELYFDNIIVDEVAISPATDRVVVATSDGTIRQYSFDGSPAPALKPHTSEIVAVAPPEDSAEFDNVFFVAHMDGRIGQWTLESGAESDADLPRYDEGPKNWPIGEEHRDEFLPVFITHQGNVLLRSSGGLVFPDNSTAENPLSYEVSASGSFVAVDDGTAFRLKSLAVNGDPLPPPLNGPVQRIEFPPYDVEEQFLYQSADRLYVTDFSPWRPVEGESRESKIAEENASGMVQQLAGGQNYRRLAWRPFDREDSSHRGVALLGADSQIRVWNFGAFDETNSDILLPLFTTETVPSTIDKLAFIGHGNTLIAFDKNGPVRAWNNDGQPLAMTTAATRESGDLRVFRAPDSTFDITAAKADDKWVLHRMDDEGYEEFGEPNFFIIDGAAGVDVSAFFVSEDDGPSHFITVDDEHRGTLWTFDWQAPSGTDFFSQSLDLGIAGDGEGSIAHSLYNGAIAVLNDQGAITLWPRSSDPPISLPARPNEESAMREDGAENSILEAAPAFDSARALAGPTELRLFATYDLGGVFLLEGERLRQTLPEIANANGGPPNSPAMPAPVGGMPAGSDPLERARASYHTAKEHLLERLRADWRDEDTRANLELIQRRLAELDRIEEERKQEQEEQEQEQDEEGEDGEGEEGEDQESDEDSEGEDSEEDPSESDSEGNPEQEQPQGGPPEEQETQETEPPEEGGEAQPADASQPQERLLTREEVMRLLDRLAELEDEREELEASLRQSERIPVPRDW